jgi:hypothetical protein
MFIGNNMIVRMSNIDLMRFIYYYLMSYKYLRTCYCLFVILEK